MPHSISSRRVSRESLSSSQVRRPKLSYFRITAGNPFRHRLERISTAVVPILRNARPGGTDVTVNRWDAMQNGIAGAEAYGSKAGAGMG